MRRRGWAGESVAHPRHGLPVAPEGGERLIPLDPLQTTAGVPGKVVGTAAARAPSFAGFTAAKTEILGNATLASALGGSAVADPDSEVYSVAFTRTSVRVSSYEDDNVLATIETWADGVAALA
jgi:hypothetical protein